jgi:hypothetical protein
MQSKVAKSWGAGCARWLGGYLLRFIIFLCLSLCVAPVVVGAVSYVVNKFDTRTALFILVPLAALAFLVPLGAMLAYAGWVFTQRRRQLDAAFSPLGLAGSGLNLTGRQYHGTLQGRRVDVYYTPGTGGLRAIHLSRSSTSIWPRRLRPAWWSPRRRPLPRLPLAL